MPRDAQLHAWVISVTAARAAGDSESDELVAALTTILLRSAAATLSAIEAHLTPGQPLETPVLTRRIASEVREKLETAAAFGADVSVLLDRLARLWSAHFIARLVAAERRTQGEGANSDAFSPAVISSLWDELLEAQAHGAPDLDAPIVRLARLQVRFDRQTAARRGGGAVAGLGGPSWPSRPIGEVGRTALGVLHRASLLRTASTNLQSMQSRSVLSGVRQRTQVPGVASRPPIAIFSRITLPNGVLAAQAFVGGLESRTAAFLARLPHGNRKVGRFAALDMPFRRLVSRFAETTEAPAGPRWPASTSRGRTTTRVFVNRVPAVQRPVAVARVSGVADHRPADRPPAPRWAIHDRPAARLVPPSLIRLIVVPATHPSSGRVRPAPQLVRPSVLTRGIVPPLHRDEGLSRPGPTIARTVVTILRLLDRATFPLGHGVQRRPTERAGSFGLRERLRMLDRSVPELTLSRRGRRRARPEAESATETTFPRRIIRRLAAGMRTEPQSQPARPRTGIDQTPTHRPDVVAARTARPTLATSSSRTGQRPDIVTRPFGSPPALQLVSQPFASPLVRRMSPAGRLAQATTRIVVDWVAGQDPWNDRDLIVEVRRIAENLSRQGVRVELVRGRQVPPGQYAAEAARPAADFVVPGPQGPVSLGPLPILDRAIPLARRPGLLHVLVAPRMRSGIGPIPGRPAVDRAGAAADLPAAFRRLSIVGEPTSFVLVARSHRRRTDQEIPSSSETRHQGRAVPTRPRRETRIATRIRPAVAESSPLTTALRLPAAPTIARYTIASARRRSGAPLGQSGTPGPSRPSDRLVARAADSRPWRAFASSIARSRAVAAPRGQATSASPFARLLAIAPASLPVRRRRVYGGDVGRAPGVTAEPLVSRTGALRVERARARIPLQTRTTAPLTPRLAREPLAAQAAVPLAPGLAPDSFASRGDVPRTPPAVRIVHRRTAQAGWRLPPIVRPGLLGTGRTPSIAEVASRMADRSARTPSSADIWRRVLADRRFDATLPLRHRQRAAVATPIARRVRMPSASREDSDRRFIRSAPSRRRSTIAGESVVPPFDLGTRAAIAPLTLRRLARTDAAAPRLGVASIRHPDQSRRFIATTAAARTSGASWSSPAVARYEGTLSLPALFVRTVARDYPRLVQRVRARHADAQQGSETGGLPRLTRRLRATRPDARLTSAGGAISPLVQHIRPRRLGRTAIAAIAPRHALVLPSSHPPTRRRPSVQTDRGSLTIERVFAMLRRDHRFGATSTATGFDAWPIVLRRLVGRGEPTPLPRLGVDDRWAPTALGQGDFGLSSLKDRLHRFFAERARRGHDETVRSGLVVRRAFRPAATSQRADASGGGPTIWSAQEARASGGRPTFWSPREADVARSFPDWLSSRLVTDITTAINQVLVSRAHLTARADASAARRDSLTTRTSPTTASRGAPRRTIADWEPPAFPRERENRPLRSARRRPDAEPGTIAHRPTEPAATSAWPRSTGTLELRRRVTVDGGMRTDGLHSPSIPLARSADGGVRLGQASSTWSTLLETDQVFDRRDGSPLPVRQYQVARAAIGRAMGDAAATPSTSASSTSDGQDQQSETGEQPDLDALARQVYAIIRQRLSWERERHGRRALTRPW